jgi:hypothetical protein
LGSTSLASPRTVRWTRSTPSGSARGRPVGVIEDTEGPDQKGTLHAWLAARAHIVPPSTMRDSNGDSNALSPTVGRQRPLMREHAKNRRCGHLCWLLIISGLGGFDSLAAHL